MPSWGVLAVVAVRAMPARVALSPLTNAGQAPIANRVMTCLVQQSYNTTSANGIPPTHTTEVVAALETPRDQDEHRLAPTTTHGRRCTHNPKVAGSNPAPATTKALVDRKIRQGFLASAPGYLTVYLTGWDMRAGQQCSIQDDFTPRSMSPE